jgi:hypothetical protein
LLEKGSLLNLGLGPCILDHTSFFVEMLGDLAQSRSVLQETWLRRLSVSLETYCLKGGLAAHHLCLWEVVVRLGLDLLLFDEHLLHTLLGC